MRKFETIAALRDGKSYSFEVMTKSADMTTWYWAYRLGYRKPNHNLPAIPRTVDWFPGHQGGIEYECAFVLIQDWNHGEPEFGHIIITQS